MVVKMINKFINFFFLVKFIGKKKESMNVFDFVESDSEEEPITKKIKIFPIGLIFPTINCPTNIRDDLSASEIQTLKQYTNLALDWGYRSGPNNIHQRFELESEKQSLIAIQKYSDIVFRSLWSIEHKSRIYMDSDIIDKLITCDDLSNQPLIQSFVSRFVKQDFEYMFDLAHIDLKSHNSPIFICIVAATRALILISTERQKEAYESLQTLADCFL